MRDLIESFEVMSSSLVFAFIAWILTRAELDASAVVETPDAILPVVSTHVEIHFARSVFDALELGRLSAKDDASSVFFAGKP